MKRPGGFERGDAGHDAPDIVDPEEPFAFLADEPDPREADRSSASYLTSTGPETSEKSKMPGPPEGEVDGASDPDDVETREVAPLKPGTRSLPVRLRRGLRAEDPVQQAKQELRRAARARKAQQRREQRRFSAAARKRRRNWYIVFGSIAALVVFVAAGVVTPLTAVRTVQVTGAQLVNEDDVVSALDRFTGTPLALVDDREVHRALEPFPLIQRYAIERIPPHTLQVRIEERLPVISVEESDEYRIYDPAGVLVGSSAERPDSVPLGLERVGDVSSPAFHAAATVLRDMPDSLRGRVTSATATSGQNLAFRLKGGVRVMWGEATETQRKAVVLSAMLEALKDESVETIDVSSSDAPVFQ